jgi:hypothetical protein
MPEDLRTFGLLVCVPSQPCSGFGVHLHQADADAVLIERQASEARTWLLFGTLTFFCKSTFSILPTRRAEARRRLMLIALA